MNAENPRNETDAAPPMWSSFGVRFIVLVILVNAGVVWGAWQDKSWGALWLAAIGGPICNVILAAIGLVVTAFQRRGPGYSLSGHLALSLGAPAAAVVIDAATIFSMPLHGC